MATNETPKSPKWDIPIGIRSSGRGWAIHCWGVVVGIVEKWIIFANCIRSICALIQGLPSARLEEVVCDGEIGCTRSEAAFETAKQGLTLIRRDKKSTPESPIENDVVVWIESNYFGKFGQCFTREIITVVTHNEEEVLEEERPSYVAKIHVHPLGGHERYFSC